MGNIKIKPISYNTPKSNLFEVNFLGVDDPSMLTENVISIHDSEEYENAIVIDFYLLLIKKRAQPYEQLEKLMYEGRKFDIYLNLHDIDGEIYKKIIYKKCTVEGVHFMRGFDYTEPDVVDMRATIVYKKMK